MTTWGRVCCIFGRHDFGRWRTVRKDMTIFGERKCRRCQRVEIGAAPKRARRKANSSDTIQPNGDIK